MQQTIGYKNAEKRETHDPAALQKLESCPVDDETRTYYWRDCRYDLSDVGVGTGEGCTRASIS